MTDAKLERTSLPPQEQRIGWSPETLPRRTKQSTLPANNNAVGNLRKATEIKKQPPSAPATSSDAPKPREWERQRTEYEQKIWELDITAATLKESAAKIAEQDKRLTDLKSLQASWEKDLATERSKLQEEWAKQSAAAKAALTKMEGMVGQDNLALKEVLRTVPAGLTKADAEKMVNSGIKKLAPDIAHNIVAPGKKPEDMTSAEWARAVRYANDLQYTSGTMEGKIANIKGKEQEIGRQKMERDKAVKGTIDKLVSDLPEGDRKSAADSYTKWLQALDKVDTTEEQRVNIKNALGAKPGSQIRSPKGEIYDVISHKDGTVTLRRDDPDTGGTVEQKVPYEKFRSSSLADGTPLAGIHEKTFWSIDAPKPDVKSDPKVAAAPKAPTSGTEKSAPAKVPVEDKSSTPAAPTVAKIAEAKKPTENPTAASDPAKAPDTKKLETATAASTATKVPEAKSPTETPKEASAPAKVVGAKKPETPAVASTPAPTKDERKTEVPTEIDKVIWFDQVKWRKYWSHTILSAQTSDKSDVSVYRDGNTRVINIGKGLTSDGNSVYNAAIKITLKDNGAIDKIVETNHWNPITGNARNKILADLKNIGITLPN